MTKRKEKGDSRDCPRVMQSQDITKERVLQALKKYPEGLTPEEKAELHMRCKALGLDSLKVLGELGWTEGETVSRQLYERAIKVIEIREKKHTN